MYPPDSLSSFDEHPAAIAFRNPDMGYFVGVSSGDGDGKTEGWTEGERLGQSDTVGIDVIDTGSTIPPRYAIPDLLTQLISSLGKNGALCWTDLG